ncbi:LCP family protein [Nocardioides sp.]|uniref:LCP family protein n=1 Tax=Nocardioides sp. TaxID=35761 RepID=UPI003526F59B
MLRLGTLGVVLGVLALGIPDSSPAPTQMTLVKVGGASGVDVNPDLVWILMVGSDARPGEDMTRTRGDALQLVGVDTRTGAAAAIGIPRDSWVSIPGYGSNKINASLYFGGPKLLGQTVGNLVGIQPDYVFVSRFPYFIEMVKSIGGIEVDNPVAFSDTYLKPGGFPAGKIHLGGYDAMAFSRIRHNLLRGDFDRSANQQRVLRGIQAKIRARADQPGFLENGVLTAMRNMATDLSPTELYRLADAAAQIKPSKITNCVVQGGIGNIGGASVVLPDTAMARRLGDRARDDATLESCS